MQLHHYQRLLHAHHSGRAVRIRTLSGRSVWGRVESLAGDIEGGELVGDAIMATDGGRLEHVDLALVLTVVVADPPTRDRRPGGLPQTT